LGGGSVVWKLPPAILFDDGAGAWYLTLAPEDAVQIEAQITFGTDTVPVVVEFDEGVPDDE